MPGRSWVITLTQGKRAVSMRVKMSMYKFSLPGNFLQEGHGLIYLSSNNKARI
jgi:hypothetical protein